MEGIVPFFYCLHLFVSSILAGIRIYLINSFNCRYQSFEFFLSGAVDFVSNTPFDIRVIYLYIRSLNLDGDALITFPVDDVQSIEWVK